MIHEKYLGKEVKCRVTSFTGIVVAVVHYLNGCIQVCIVPSVGKEKKIPEGEYIDIGQIDIVGDGIHVKPKNTGGPQRYCPKR